MFCTVSYKLQNSRGQCGAIVIILIVHLCSNNLVLSGEDPIRSCNDIHTGSGLYSVVVKEYSPKPFSVFCNMLIDGGGWTLMLRRQNAAVSFTRPLKDYEEGFGNVKTEFFLGLKKIYALGLLGKRELMISVADFSGNHKAAKYSDFKLGDAKDRYRLLSLGSYSGHAGDSMTPHLGMPFQTKDHDDFGCAKVFGGGWWYMKTCFQDVDTGRPITNVDERPRQEPDEPKYRWAVMMTRVIR